MIHTLFFLSYLFPLPFQVSNMQHYPSLSCASSGCHLSFSLSNILKHSEMMKEQILLPLFFESVLASDIFCLKESCLRNSSGDSRCPGYGKFGRKLPKGFL